jgi:hypothetical protein
MGRQLHLFERQGNIFRTLSLIRQDMEKNCNRPDVKATPSGCGPYYGIYMQQKCNRPDFRATTSGRDLDMVLRGVHYEKLVAQLSVWTASACVRKPPREN